MEVIYLHLINVNRVYQQRREKSKQAGLAQEIGFG
jgi:hypothetical protein